MARSLLGILLTASCVAALSGCADQTIDQWRQEKVNEQLNKYQAVAGIYTGILVSASTSQPLGEIALEVEPDTTVAPSNDQLSSENRAVLRGKLSFQGQTDLFFQSGYFDPNTGVFNAVLPLTLRDSSTVTLSLKGKFDGNSLSGKLVASGFSNIGGTFLVNRGTAADAQRLVGSRPVPGGPIGGAKVDRYSGIGEAVDGSKKNLVLSVIRTQLSMQEEFLSLIYPVHLVDLTLEFGFENGMVPVLFANARWDSSTGVLKGTAEGRHGNDPYKLMLDCRQVALETGAMALSCNYVSSLRGYMFTALFKPVGGVNQ